MKNTIKTYCIILAMISITTFSSAQTVRNVAFFDGIETYGNLSVTLIQSNTTKVEIDMIKGDESDIITKIKKNTLTLKTKNQWKTVRKVNPRAKVKVYYKNLDDISGAAGSSIVGNDVIEGNDLDVSSSSGASVKLEVSCTSIDVDASSGGVLRISGSASQAEIEASSGGAIQANKLIVKHVEAEASSGGAITCHASKSIEANASSGGAISYSGNPSHKEIESGFSGSVSGN